MTKKAKADDRRRAARIMERLAEHGRDGVSGEQLKPEGMFSDGHGGRLQMFALRGHQLRLYGGWVRNATPPTFAFTAFDIKKQNKADKAVLEKAAVALGELG